MTSHRLNLIAMSCVTWLLLLTSASAAAIPEWIWADNHGAKTADNEVRYFRKTFRVTNGMSKAELSACADDELTVYINGKQVLEAKGWEKMSFADITKDIHNGENVIAIRGKNLTGQAAIIAMLNMSYKRQTQSVVTDASWLSSKNEAAGWMKSDFESKDWAPAVSLGKVGLKPYGDVFTAPQATPAESLTLLPGFKAQLIRSAQPWEGSWVCMAIDPKGRLIVSPQQGTGNLLRFTLTHDGQIGKIETIDQPIGGDMGLLCAFDSLYANGSGPDGVGIYRLKYNRHTDNYDAPVLIRPMQDATGEHGSHAVVLGPDKHLYVVSGNFTKIPKDILPTSPHRNYAEDQLLPRAQDGNGFGNGVLPPGGSLLRMDPDGKNCKLFCAGMRNTYDVAFNTDGEILGFDSDMEWDWGMPWYRPIRICHLVSGGDYGFREGTGKWPKYYPDSLPSTVDVGIGSPTGMKFGTDSKFPDKYKKALFALDWSYGRIFAVHLTPNGATYDATFEAFLKGKPLNLTDIEFGHDGAMYFTTGGRGTQSGLYRVTYDGSRMKSEPGPSHQELKVAKKARDIRHDLEAFQGKQDPKAVDFCWPYLNSDDRWIRYAARIAIESQPVSEWQDRALAETNKNAGLTALLALARCGSSNIQGRLFHALNRFHMESLDEADQLVKLRVMELSFIRQGRPEEQLRQFVVARLDPLYPAKSEWLNRELCEILVYLEAPDVVTKTLALLDAAPTQEEQIHYILHLRTLKKGWTKEQHEHYLSWFNRDREGELGAPTYEKGSGYYLWKNRHGDKPEHSVELLKWFTDAGREYGDGSSFPKFIANFRKDAVDSMTDAERTDLAYIITGVKPAAPAPKVAPRKFVNDWKMADLEPLLGQAMSGRSFARGKSVFTAAQCLQCHRFGNEGGSVGPDLTAISSRFNNRDILESILEPSKVISEQFQNTLIIKKDGDDFTGRIIDEDDKKLTLVTNPLTQTKEVIQKADIQTRQASRISPMPEGLVNTFSDQEILDLIAYLTSGGKETAAAFKK